jgi:hypothetical protein
MMNNRSASKDLSRERKGEYAHVFQLDLPMPKVLQAKGDLTILRAWIIAMRKMKVPNGRE